MEGGSKVIAVTTRSVPFSPLPFSLPLALLYVAPPGLSPAHTYLKQHLQPL
jgi:hypothetical protein